MVRVKVKVKIRVRVRARIRVRVRVEYSLEQGSATFWTRRASFRIISKCEQLRVPNFLCVWFAQSAT